MILCNLAGGYEVAVWQVVMILCSPAVVMSLRSLAGVYDTVHFGRWL